MSNVFRTSQQTIIPSIFEQQEKVDEAVVLLHKMGLNECDIDVRDVNPGELRSEGLLAEAAEKAMLRGTAQGSTIGLVIGVSVALFLIFSHRFGPTGLIAGIVGGTLFGALLGAYRGVAMMEFHWNASTAEHNRAAFHPGDILVSVQSGEQYQAVHQLLETHGVRDFLDPVFYAHLPNPV